MCRETKELYDNKHSLDQQLSRCFIVQPDLNKNEVYIVEEENYTYMKLENVTTVNAGYDTDKAILGVEIAYDKTFKILLNDGSKLQFTGTTLYIQMN